MNYTGIPAGTITGSTAGGISIGPPATVPTIADRHAELNKGLNHLDSRIEHLREKLALTLKPCPPQPTSERLNPIVPSSPMGDQLANTHALVNGLIGKIEDVIERLDL